MKSFLLSAIWIILLSILIIVGSFGLYLIVDRYYDRLIPSKITVHELENISDSSSQIGAAWAGLCPKDQVHSVSDFKRIVESDPILLSHIGKVDWSGAKLIRTENAEKAIVAHRSGKIILPTKKPIYLPAGDLRIIIGQKEFRAHCCNDVEHKEVIEPTPGPIEVVNVMPPPVPMDIPVEIIHNDYTPQVYPFLPNPYYPPVISKTPESASMILFGSGLVLFGLLKRKMK